jgi:hypothetical protein
LADHCRHRASGPGGDDEVRRDAADRDGRGRALPRRNRRQPASGAPARREDACRAPATVSRQQVAARDKEGGRSQETSGASPAALQEDAVRHVCQRGDGEGVLGGSPNTGSSALRPACGGLLRRQFLGCLRRLIHRLHGGSEGWTPHVCLVVLGIGPPEIAGSSTGFGIRRGNKSETD